MKKTAVTLSFFLLAFTGPLYADKIRPPETIFLTTEDGIELRANHYKAGNEKVLLVVPGFIQNKDTQIFRSISESFLPKYDVLTLDLRGHGQSEGKFYLTAKESEDLKKALIYAHQHYSKVGVIGFSLGAALAIVVAGETDFIDSLVVVSPPSEFKKINCHFWRKEALSSMKEKLLSKETGVRLGNPFLKKPSPIDSVKKIKKTPVFFIHGTDDWLIRPQHSKQLYDAAIKPKKIKIVQHGLHAEKIFGQFPNEFHQWIDHWFDDTLK